MSSVRPRPWVSEPSDGPPVLPDGVHRGRASVEPAKVAALGAPRLARDCRECVGSLSAGWGLSTWRATTSTDLASARRASGIGRWLDAP